MLMHQVLDTLPIWANFLITVALLIVIYEIGYRWGHWVRRRRGPSTKDNLGNLISTEVVLLVFMLGFVFAMASTRFYERKELVLQEANAIGTSWLRARTLPPPYAERLTPLYWTYLNLRLERQESLNNTKEKITAANRLQDQLWSGTIELARAHPDSPLVAIFIESVNEMFDLQQSRITEGLEYRVAPSVWRTLYLVAVLAFIAMGYQAGQDGERHPLPVSLSLVGMLAFVIVLIIDLDRPAQRLFQVDLHPLQDLHETMAKQRQ